MKAEVNYQKLSKSKYIFKKNGRKLPMIEKELDKAIIAQRILNERKLKGWTQKELHERVGTYSEKTVRDWEKGNTKIPTEGLIKLAEIFECDINYLIGKYEHRTKEATDICKVTGLSEAAVNVLIENKDSTTDNPIAPFISEFILNCDEIMSHICNIIILSHFEKAGAFDEISKIAKGSSEQYRKVTKADGFQIEYIDDVQLERDIVIALKRAGVSDADIKFLRATTLGFTFDYKKQIDVSMFTLSNSFVEIVKKYVKEGAEDGK